MRTRWAPLAILLSLGCSQEAKEAPRPRPVEAPAEAAQPEPLDVHMQAHFSRVREMANAIIDGDLETAQAPAAWLAAHDAVPDAPDEWRVHLDRMRSLATDVASAEEVPKAAATLGEMAGVCGSCHESRKVKILLPQVAIVGEGSPADRMMRHQWAVDRLREGLVANSDRAWELGAEVLTAAPLEACDIPGGDVLTQDALDLRLQVQALGTTATKATDRPSRERVYGELLGTCAGCHRGGC